MTSSHLHVTEWLDPVVAATAYSGDFGYVELFWLPVLGPSATMLLWRLQGMLDAHSVAFSVNLDALGQQLGLGTCESKHAPLLRAISRLIHFGLATRTGSGELAVRCEAQPLSPHLLRSLSPALQLEHAQFVRRVGTADDPGLLASGPSPTTDRTDG